MTAPNFGPNSLCGPSTVFQRRWPNRGGGPKMAKTDKLHLAGTKFSKMTASHFGSNSLCGPCTAFQGAWPNQGGGPQNPPKKLQFVAQAAQNSQNWHSAPFRPQIFQNDSPKFWAKFFYVALIPFFKDGGQAKGEAHKTPPRSDNL